MSTRKSLGKIKRFKKLIGCLVGDPDSVVTRETVIVPCSDQICTQWRHSQDLRSKQFTPWRRRWWWWLAKEEKERPGTGAAKWRGQREDEWGGWSGREVPTRCKKDNITQVRGITTSVDSDICQKPRTFSNCVTSTCKCIIYHGMSSERSLSSFWLIFHSFFVAWWVEVLWAVIRERISCQIINSFE